MTVCVRRMCVRMCVRVCVLTENASRVVEHGHPRKEREQLDCEAHHRENQCG